MITIDGQSMTLEEVERVARHREQVQLSPQSRERMQASRLVIERILETGQVVYGVNTGFGKLADVRIAPDQMETLQRNLVRSHACGVGDPLPVEEVRAMMLLRGNALAAGFSGARVEVAEILVEMLNRGVHPPVPSQGSVGASGDLAPLAHLALTIMGDDPLLEQAGLSPLRLQAKEGLAMLNGTQAMMATGGLALLSALRIAHTADVAGAMSLEALRGTPVAFDDAIQRARPHAGQGEVAAHLRHLLRDSQIRQSHLRDDPRVQDAYSLRCMPQVHGAVRDALAYARSAIETETGSATDNPLVFADTGDVLSGGNFHGAPLGYALDFAAIAMTDLAGISERRIDRLINPDKSEGLPPFLSAHPGISSGFMMAHVTAAAMLNEARVLAHPASIDNVSTSGGKEDHVSMGMTAALKFRRLVECVSRVIAIELMAAAEGLEYCLPLEPGSGVRAAKQVVRRYAPRLDADRSLSGEIEQISRAITSGAF